MDESTGDFGAARAGLVRALSRRSQAEDTERATVEELVKARAARDGAARRAADDVAEYDRAIERIEARLTEARAAVRTARSESIAALEEFGRYTDPRESLGELTDGSPILLFPVRLETRFAPAVDGAGPHLLVRIFPDTCVIDSFEEQLSDAELDSAKTFWRQMFEAGSDIGSIRAAWRNLVAGHGSGRAGWIVTTYRPVDDGNVGDTTGPALPPDPPTRGRSWTRAPRVTVLPERFVLVTVHDTKVKEYLGGLVRQPLSVGLDPSAPLVPKGPTLELPDELKWMSDFDEAVAIGLGFRIPLSGAEADGGFDRLYVVGVALRYDDDAGHAALNTHIDHLRYSRSGFGLVRQGTPTNNTAGEDSGYTPWEDPDVSYDLVNTPTPPPTENRLHQTDGERLAHLVGIDPGIVMRTQNATGSDQAHGYAADVALFPATLGYFMTTLMDPVFDEDTVEDVRSFFLRHVSGAGAVPAVRIGRQPYGILPTTAFSRIRWTEPDGEGRLDFAGRLHRVLTAVRPAWDTMATDVAHVGGSGGSDARQRLLDILGLHPSSAEFHYRYSQSRSAIANMLALAGVDPGLINTIDEIRREAAMRLLRDAGYQGATRPTVLDQFFHGAQGILDGGVVWSEPKVAGFETEHTRYIGWLVDAARNSLEAVRGQSDMPGGTVPRTLLYLLLRHALLLGYYDTGRKLNLRPGVYDPVRVAALRREEPILGVSRAAGAPVSRYASLHLADARITGSSVRSIADYITGNLPTLAEARHLREQIEALEVLESTTAAEADRALRDHVDTCSYRLDAWLLGLVNHQLNRMRIKNDGVYLGAYGWLEDVRPKKRTLTPADPPADIAEDFGADPNLAPLQKDSTSGGFIHAPSLNQAVTAAVLRSAWMTSPQAERGGLSVNLSSRRVRRALSLIEGMRNGQPLGALLGYQLERGLHDGHALGEVDTLIYRLRAVFPLRANKLRDTHVDLDPLVPEVIDAVDARNVVDGRAVVEHLDAGGSLENILTGTSAAQRQALDREVADIRDMLDGLSDLTLAEGVHQAVLGNFDRVASTYDAFGAGGLPTEPEVVRTPGAGLGLTHRVALHLKAGPRVPQATTTPRVVAEPAAAEWLAATLPALNIVACTARWKNLADNSDHSTTIDLGQLGLSALDVVSMWPAEGLDGFEEIEDRIVTFVAGTNSATLRTDATVTIETRVAPAGKLSLFEVAPLITHVKALLAHARPLRASDMALQQEATARTDSTLSIDLARIATVRDRLSALQAEVSTRHDALEALLEALDVDNPPPPAVDAVIAVLDAAVTDTTGFVERASLFGLGLTRGESIANQARRTFGGLIRALTDRVARFDAKLDACQTKLDAYTDAPVGTSDEVKVTLLRQAEAEVSTLAPIPAATASALFIAVMSRRDQLLAKRNAFVGLTRTADRSLAALVQSADGLLPIDSFDSEQFDLAAHRQQYVVFARDLAALLKSLLDDISRRVNAANKTIAEHDAATDPPKKLAALQAAAEALLGEDAVVIPEFTLAPASGLEFTSAVAASTPDKLFRHLIEQSITLPVDEWFCGLARVRAQLRHAEGVSLLASGFKTGEFVWTAVQLPYAAGDYWLGLDFPPTYEVDSERLLYTAHFVEPFDRGEPQCGLLLDEWTEVLPGQRFGEGMAAETVHTQTTGVAVNFDRPDAEAPQSWLLVTPAHWDGNWHWRDLRDAIPETMDLARLRAVEPDQIAATSYAGFLPATVMAATMRDITISTVLARNIRVTDFVKE